MCTVPAKPHGKADGLPGVRIDYTLSDTEYGDSVGITILPHVRDFSITGPLKVTGVSDTPSRRRIFVCRPTDSASEDPCARKILSTLARRAYRTIKENLIVGVGVAGMVPDIRIWFPCATS